MLRMIRNLPVWWKVWHVPRYERSPSSKGHGVRIPQGDAVAALDRRACDINFIMRGE